MNSRRSMLKDERGFTLIEIIAVLVVLGILAAVAVPKFLDMQVQARQAAVNGALAAAASNVTSAQAQNLLTGGNGTVTSVLGVLNSTTTPYTTVGDFTVSYTTGTGTPATSIIITVTGAPSNITLANVTTTTKTVQIQ